MSTTQTIPVMAGDGIGPEIWDAARRVFDAAIRKYASDRKIQWVMVPAGQTAFDTVGSYLPDSTIEAIRHHKIALKGPLTTPVGGGIRSINVTLRKTFDLYACVRPVKWFEGVPSPVKTPEGVDMVIFRENTEDIYAGIEWPHNSVEAQTIRETIIRLDGKLNVPFPESTGFGIKPISLDGSRRLIKAAIDFAITHGRRSVTMVHKGNIMKYTEGAFRNWGYELAETEYAESVFSWRTFETLKNTDGMDAAKAALDAEKSAKKVIINDHICDAFFQDSLLCPETFDVVATTNLNGDYISDALAAQVGGIGLAPGANINYNSGYAIFEATHGTAPSIAGKNIANPSAMILSGVLMFHHLGWTPVADAIFSGLSSAFKQGIVTADLNPRSTIGTREFSETLITLI